MSCEKEDVRLTATTYWDTGSLGTWGTPESQDPSPQNLHYLNLFKFKFIESVSRNEEDTGFDEDRRHGGSDIREVINADKQ